MARNSKRSFFESRNPVMKEQAFQNAAAQVAGQAVERMTVEGATNKTFILAGILLFTALIGYTMPNPLFIWPAAIAGLGVVIFASFKPHLSPILAPIYAAIEGLFVGAISVIYAGAYSGIVFQAITLTIAVLFMMLFIYKSGIIKVTNKFRTGVMMATGAIFLVYLISFVLSFFGISVPFLHEGGVIGIGISLVIIGVAALNLLLDFDNFEKGARYGAPQYMEWFCAMGLIITLVWLYLEILRLLSILSSD